MRIIYPPKDLGGTVMLITAGFGLVCNLIMVYVLHRKDPEDDRIGGCNHVGHNHGDHSHHHHGHEHKHDCHGHEHDHHEHEHKHDHHEHEHKHDHHEHEHKHDHHEHDEKNHGRKNTNKKVGNLQTADNSLFSSVAIIDKKKSTLDSAIKSDKNVEKSSKKSEKKTIKESDNANIRAAFIHIIGDIVQSIGVLIASVIIYFKKDWIIADPICTF